jgi:hypothetical protein
MEYSKISEILGFPGVHVHEGLPFIWFYGILVL